MRRFLVRFSESEASNHTPSLADFTTTTPELKFSVRAGAKRPRISAQLSCWDRLYFRCYNATQWHFPPRFIKFQGAGASVASGRVERRSSAAPVAMSLRAERTDCALGGLDPLRTSPPHSVDTSPRWTAKRCHSPGTPLRVWRPRSSKPIPEPTTRSFTVLETRISPASAALATRFPI